MMKKLVLMTVLFSFACSSQAKESDVDLPLNAKTALQEMERAILQAKQKAVEKLKVAMKNEMQLGNLGRANRINQEIAKISEIAEEKKGNDDAQSLIVGEWKRSDGFIYKLTKKNELVGHNGYWTGSWRADNKKVNIIIETQDGKPLPSKTSYIYELPVQREVGGQKKMVMQLANGSKELTLYKVD